MRKYLKKLNIKNMEEIEVKFLNIKSDLIEKKLKEIVLEPHGAVGFAGLKRFMAKEKSSSPSVCLETAHPGKFPEKLRKILSIKIELPQTIKELEYKNENFNIIPADYKDLKNFLKNKFQPEILS